MRDPEKAVIKIKSKLTKQLFEALTMQSGDVMLGAGRSATGTSIERYKSDRADLNAAKRLVQFKVRAVGRLKKVARRVESAVRGATRQYKQWG